MEPKGQFYYGQEDMATAELTYTNEQLEPEDVEDILDKLHIGTLRREELRKDRSISQEENHQDEGGSARNPTSQFTRQDSRLSRSSYASTGSGSSGEPSAVSRRSSATSATSGAGQAAYSRQSSVTSEMGIQTTLGRQSGAGLSAEQPDSDDKKSESRKERKTSSSKDKRRSGRGRRMSRELMGDLVAVPELPQAFIVKYMGKRPTKGVWGSKHTTKHVEDIVDSVGKLAKHEDLPLVHLEVHYQGLLMRPHKKNKVPSFTAVRIPIQFISYGLQDPIYPRVFCFIMVAEMSSQKKSMECHAYVCDSPRSAHNVAACLSIAFGVYSERMQQHGYRFEVQVGRRRRPEEEEDSCDV